MHQTLLRLSGLLLLTGSLLSAVAQDECKNSDWYIGASTGINLSNLHYSNLDDSFYPDRHNNLSGLFSIFFEYDFGKNRNFGIRPTFSFLTRGGRISNIGENYWTDYQLPPTDPDRLEDVIYSLKATYMDIRIPVIYHIGSYDWKVRPYVFLAPIMGFANNGKTKAEFRYADGEYTGVEYPLTKSNMNPFYFAGAAGVGAKWQLSVGCSKIYIGVDISYQLGFTNTYGSDEKKGNLNNIVSLGPWNSSKVIGSRKLNGLEIAASVGIPLSLFRKQHRLVSLPEVEEPEYRPSYIEEEPIVEEKPCYTLEEISMAIENGENVYGKKICAIDDNINFDFGKSTINPSSYPYLNSLAELFKKTGMKVKVSGHTDNVGTPEYNMELSKQRTMAVVKYLKKRGVRSSAISYSWYGLTHPQTSNETEEGRRINRRVEFEIQ
ncbi:MAG: OmpA family protein [Muribaculaceae bacterium]|nr:OmpA family protein [Muribaculaceae bacterium]